jgi:acyl dehydratase
VDRTLESSPSLLPLYARTAMTLIPLVSRLPFVAASAASDDMPELALTVSPVYVDRERLSTYSHVCGFSLSDVLPATYIHVLAFPLQLKIMAEPSFPFRLAGLVHIGNEITQHRPIRASEVLSLRAWPTAIELHRRGRQFSLRTEARVGEEVVWEEVSTILQRGGGSPDAAAPNTFDDDEELPTTATWKLRGDLGRRYGSVSGDINPIHMHWAGAKLFGFPSAIAHGLWTKARCLAALEGRLPETFTVEVAFKRPIVLPATVAFGEMPLPADAGRAGIRFGVWDERRETPHLDGAVKFG